MILNPINKSLNFLGKHHKKTFWGVVIANIFSSFLEMISLALIPILISVMLKLEDYENFLPNFDIIEKLLAKNHSEKFILLSLAIPVLFFGFYPEPLMNTIEISVKNLIDMYNFNLNMYSSEVQQ